METIPARHLVLRAKNPAHWFGAEYNMNIYRGCTHGCIYCDSRSACYGNPEFDTVKAKANALAVLRDDLSRIRTRGVIATGAMSDPYNPYERDMRLTRGALELIGAYGFGVAIATKGALAARDADILRAVAQGAPVIVKITITTAADALCRRLEPGARPTSERLEALRVLSGSGLFCGVLMMPILPFINDTEANVLGIAEAAARAGARFVYPAMGMTMRTGSREYYYEKLDALFPGLKRLYAQRYGNGYVCESPDAQMLTEAFERRCDALGLLFKMEDIINAYKGGHDKRQLSFFEDGGE